jgi:hypothetical protein
MAKATEKIRVRLTTPHLAGQTDRGVYFAKNAGEELEFDLVSAGRMFLTEQAEAVNPEDTERAIEAARKDGRPLGDPRNPLIGEPALAGAAG